jgi:hypothetical protein
MTRAFSRGELERGGEIMAAYVGLERGSYGHSRQSNAVKPMEVYQDHYVFPFGTDYITPTSNMATHNLRHFMGVIFTQNTPPPRQFTSRRS